MTIQYINTGTSPNAGNGDTLRLAFTKINNNFLQLAENLLSSVPSAVNEYGKILSSDGTNLVWIDAPRTLVAGTYTLALTTSGQITINDVPLSSGSGYTGSTGAGFNFRGTWVSGSYSPGDIVTYNGVTYLCVAPWSYYDPSYAYPNGAWEIISGPRGSTGYTGSIGQGGNGSIVQSQDAPSSPTTSTLWYNTLDGRTYVYYDESWVDANPISQGYNGYTGSQGLPGEAAAIGYTGSQGEPGSPGGYTGSAGGCGGLGYTGSAGSCGAMGYTGSQGQPGCCGGIGYTGSMGACGGIGYTGSQGSAMTLISDTPPIGQTTGTFWYNSVTGRTYIRYDDAWVDSSPTSSGYTGSAGGCGAQGGLGYTGSAGSAGSCGSQGYTGSAGACGTMGYTGSTGSLGYTGSGGNVFDQALFTTSSVQFNSLEVRNTDDATGLIIFGDGNHEIYARFHNQFDFWEYGGLLAEDKGFRFFTGGNKYEQVERLHIANDGVQIMRAYILPTVDGSVGQVMTTNGSGGELYWDTPKVVARRSSISGTTGALANLTTGTVTLTGFKSYVLYKLSTSVAAWVRIYSDAASQTADASRVQTADPLPGSGVISEVVTTPGSLVQKITPGVIGVNLDDSPNSNVYITVTNLSGTTTPVTVSLTVLQLES